MRYILRNYDVSRAKHGEIGVISYEYNSLAKEFSFFCRDHAERGKRRVYPAEAGTQSYKYNNLNQICSVSSSSSMSSFEYDHDPLGQRIKSEEVTTKSAKYTKYLMNGMVEQARWEENPKFEALNPKQIQNSNSAIFEKARFETGNSKLDTGKMQYHTLGIDLAGSLTTTGAVGAVLSSTTYNLPLPLGEGKGEGVMSQHYFYAVNPTPCTLYPLNPSSTFHCSPDKPLKGVAEYFRWYNQERAHSSIEKRTPMAIFDSNA